MNRTFFHAMDAVDMSERKVAKALLKAPILTRFTVSGPGSESSMCILLGRAPDFF